MIRSVRDQEKGLRKLNRPIRADVIKDMAAQCGGVSNEIIQKLTEYVDENAGEISFSIFEAKKGLLKINHALDKRTVDNINALSEIEKILEAANYLSNRLSGLRFSREQDSEIPSPLETHLEFYMRDNDLTTPEDIAEDILNKEEAWKNFLGLLEYHTSVLEKIKLSLTEVQPKRGGQNSIILLTSFFVHIGKMYVLATGKKFTITGYDGFPKKSQSFNFAKMATQALAGVYNGIPIPPLDERNYLLAYKNSCQQLKKDSDRSK